jgi:PH and SEC7 domain-containing protein
VITHNGGNRGHRISSSDSLAVGRKSRIPVNQVRVPSSQSAPQSPQSNSPRYHHSHIPIANGVASVVNQKKTPPRFEAYMMTGDLILNLSRTPQSSSLLPAQTKKVDSLRDSPVRNLKRKNGTAPKAIYDSSPSDSSSDIVSHQENNVESNKNNRNNKLSRISNSIENGSGRLNSITSSVDEEEEQLIMDSSSNEHSECDDRKKKFNLIKSGCAKNSSSSSSSNSSPTNTNSSNNIDDGGGGGIGRGSDEDNLSSKKYSVLEECNEDIVNNMETKNNNKNIQQKQPKHERGQQLIVTHSASMSSTTTTSSASTTINRSETLLTTPLPDGSHSVPTSPTSLSATLLEVTAKRRDLACSVPTSPECNQQEAVVTRRCSTNSQQQSVSYARKTDASGFRTSRSEDHLQLSQREGTLGNAIPIDIDEDVTSSLNTLLDTRHDSESESQSSDHDRIVWTYNAPIPPSSNSNHVIVSPTSRSSSISTSPQHTDSPASPTSVSSSVMTSSGSKGKDLSLLNSNGGTGMQTGLMTMSGEQSVSEAISNISSPDYQDEHDLLSARDLSAAMAISDPSDSDSTLIVDEKEKNVIPIADAEVNKSTDPLKDSEDELATLTEEPFNLMSITTQREASPPISDDGSDVDSLHSFHYSPKAVDMPSAIRLAKRLYTLDGFKKSDVSRHLSKK